MTAIEVGDDAAALAARQRLAAAAGGDRRSSAARYGAAGSGVDLADRRRLRRRPPRGVGLAWSSSAARTSRSGPPSPCAAVGAWRWPSAATKTPCGICSSAASWRIDSATTGWQLVAGAAGHPGRGAWPAGRGPGRCSTTALRLSLATRRHPQRDSDPARVRPVGARGGRSGAGGAVGRRRPRACASACGFGMWPMLRRGEAELRAQIREALGPDRFEEVFAAGTRAHPAGGGRASPGSCTPLGPRAPDGGLPPEALPSVSA